MGTKVEATWECAKHAQGHVETKIPYLKVTGLTLAGLNGSNGLMRMHWTRAKRYKEAVAALVSTPRGRPEPFDMARGGKVGVLLVRAHKARPMDTDNLHASAKPVLDALVRARIIPDDGPNVIELTVRQKPRKELGCDWIVYLCQENPPCPAPAPCLPSN